MGLLLLLVAPPQGAAGQFAAPCEVACALTLGATGFVAATGTVVAVGRLRGLNTVQDGLGLWGSGYVLAVGSGMALSGNGMRQRRAVYGAAVGVLSGAALGLAVESVRTRGDGARMVAGTLIGAVFGAVIGGAYGAISYDEATSSGPVPLFSARLAF